MINILSDGSVFIGDIINGQKQGKGEYYFLADMFVAYKVAGEWNDNKLNGVATIFTTDYEEIGQYEIGVKNGDFFHYYYNGVLSIISYKNGVRTKEEVISRTSNRYTLVKI